MIDCVKTEVRDALPDLLHGRLSELDMATMTAHVESCPECRAELALLRDVRSSAPLAPAIDTARIASVLPPYGGAAVVRNLPVKPERKTSWRVAILAASAAIAIALGGVALTSVRNANDDGAASAIASRGGSAAVSVAVPSTTVDPLPSAKPVVAAAPTQVATKPAARQVASLSFVGGTQDLSESELETLLAELDGMESIPAAEPQSVTLSVEDIEGGT